MCKIIRIAGLGVLLGTNASPQAVGDGTRPFRQVDATPTTLHKPIADDEVVRELAAQPTEVWRTYSDISTMSAPVRRSAFRLLSTSMKAAVIRHHALRALADHPEFTHEQKAVIADFPLLITPELYEIPSSSPLWSERVDTPLQEIKARALSLFDAKLARTIFADVGPDPEAAARPAEPISSTTLRVAADSLRSPLNFIR